MASPGRPTQLRERPRALLPVLPAGASAAGSHVPLHPEQWRAPLAKAQLGRQHRGFQQRTAHVAQQPGDAHLRLVQRQIVGLVTRVVLPAKGQLHATTQPYRPDPHPLQHRPLIDESGWQHLPRRP